MTAPCLFLFEARAPPCWFHHAGFLWPLTSQSLYVHADALFEIYRLIRSWARMNGQVQEAEIRGISFDLSTSQSPIKVIFGL